MTTKLGLDVFLDERLDLVAGKRVGLVVSASSTDALLASTIERLHENPAVNLVALFGPEHGLRGEAQAGQHVVTTNDAITGLPVYSLYGDTQKPTPEMLQGIDVMIVDMQDGGVRFYTYLYTMAYVMQAAAENGLPVIVLDRPAPLNGTNFDGPMLNTAFASFVGLYPIPIRYGMTIGEIAGLFNDGFGIGCKLTVVPMQNWTRGLWYDQSGLPFIPPSPNLPTLSAINAYVGTCLVEGTTLSEGRGTTKPFEYIGAPWIKAEPLARALNDLGFAGVRFRPVYFTPTFSKYQGQLCAGVHLVITNRDTFRPIQMVCSFMSLVKDSYPGDFAWRDSWASDGTYPIDLLSGSDRLRKHLDANKSVSALFSQWESELETFAALRSRFLIYAD